MKAHPLASASACARAAARALRVLRRHLLTSPAFAECGFAAVKETFHRQLATCNRPGSRFALGPAARGQAPKALGCVLLLAVGSVVFPLRAQDTNAAVPSNGISAADDTMAADASATATDVREEDATGTNTLSDTNQVFEPGPDGRTRRLRWQAQLRSRLKPQTNSEPRMSASTNAGPGLLDYSSFRIIAERNIFDPNRVPHSGVASAQPKTVDAFSLVGTMSYEKGIFAFFDGTRSDYKKVLKPNDTIAGYKVLSISSDAVKLQMNTNTVQVSVGTQMRRRDDGTWDRSASTETYAATTAATTSPADTASAPTGAESDVLKKLMERRLKE